MSKLSARWLNKDDNTLRTDENGDLAVKLANGLEATVNGIALKLDGDTVTVGASGVKVTSSYLNSFARIAISGQSDVVADAAQDTVTLVAGSGIILTTNAETDSVTIEASGGGAAHASTHITGGNDIIPNAVASGNSGLMSGTDKAKLDGIASGAEVNQNAFNTIAVSGQSNVVAGTTTDTLNLVGAGGLTITTNAGTNTVTFTAGASQNVFNTIAVSGQSDVVADSTSDTLTLVAGTNVTITTDAATDAITISASGGSTGDRFDMNLPATYIPSGQEVIFGGLTVPTGKVLTIDAIGIKQIDGSAGVANLICQIYNQTDVTELTNTTSDYNKPSSITGAAGKYIKFVAKNSTGSAYTVMAFVQATLTDA